MDDVEKEKYLTYLNKIVKKFDQAEETEGNENKYEIVCVYLYPK